ncbi:MAG: UbiA prenyltransferase family protein, partial [Pseudomonadota bacterium]
MKNLIIFVPWLLAGSFAHFGPVLQLFVAFCVMAMAVYAFNDVIDVDHDRRHAKKRHRPIPSGRLIKREAIALSAVLAVISLYLASSVSSEGAAVIAAYAVLNFFYSLVGKRIPMLDVAIVAAGFVLRILIGLLATDTLPSFGWILAPVFLASVSMAIGKRYAKVGQNGLAGDHRVPAFYTEGRMVWLMIAAWQVTIGVTTALAIHNWGGLNPGQPTGGGMTISAVIVAIAISTQVLARMLVSRTEPTAFSKYPRQSIIEKCDPNRRSQKKYGFFQSERHIFASI